MPFFLLTFIIASYSRAMRREKKENAERKKERQLKAILCLIKTKHKQARYMYTYTAYFLPALWQRPEWRRLSLFQICLHWRLASQGQPWPPSPAPQAALAPASLLWTQMHTEKKFDQADCSFKKTKTRSVKMVKSMCIVIWSRQSAC